LIDQDHPAERGQSFDEPREWGKPPLCDHVAEPLVDEHEIHRPIAHDLVGDAEVSGHCVAGLRLHLGPPWANAWWREGAEWDVPTTVPTFSPIRNSLAQHWCR